MRAVQRLSHYGEPGRIYQRTAWEFRYQEGKLPRLFFSRAPHLIIPKNTKPLSKEHGRGGESTTVALNSEIRQEPSHQKSFCTSCSELLSSSSPHKHPNAHTDCRHACASVIAACLQDIPMRHPELSLRQLFKVLLCSPSNSF